MKQWLRDRQGKPTRLGLLACLLVATASCSSTDGPDPFRGWRQGQTWTYEQEVNFDNVATASYRHTVAWVRRPGSDLTELDYWQIIQGGTATRVELPPPPAPVAIPVAVAQDSHRWLSVAVTRDVSHGTNTGLVAWHGDGTTGDEADPPRELLLPSGTPGSLANVSAAQLAEKSVVVASVGGQPVVWARSAPDARWFPDHLDTGVDDLIHVKVSADGERFVLAGVDESGRGHLWTSSAGRTWRPAGGDDLPTEATKVATLSLLGQGETVIGWSGPSGGDVRGTTDVTVQKLAGDTLTDLGHIDAAQDDLGYQRFDPTDATLTPGDEVLLVGEGIRSDGQSTPMMWVRSGDKWKWSEKTDLTDQEDLRIRSVATTTDGEMVALLSGILGADIGVRRWQDG